MFLRRLVDTNPGLLRAAIDGHRAGEVRAGTYLVDVDRVEANAAAIQKAAADAGVATYVMAKQYGRNPDVSRAAMRAGLGAVVCVDLQCLGAAVRHGVPVGHVGHLVQPHRGAEDMVAAARPEVVTVFTETHAGRIGAAAVRHGVVQPLLLRVRTAGDTFYFGHDGGFELDDVVAAAGRVARLPGVEVAGVTTFPCLLADESTREVRPTHNLSTLVDAADRLRRAGFDVRQVNAPGTTSARTLALLAEAGATHVEPGNAVHGTAPSALADGAPERPAIVLVSEVSHFVGDDAYVFAAGYYVDKVLGEYPLTAAVGRDESALDRILPVDTASDAAIHYYCVIPDARRHGVAEGDTVVFGFRPQAFVTRARTQAVTGVSVGTPRFRRVYDDEAHLVDDMS